MLKMTKLRFGPFIFSLKYGYFKKLEGCPLQFWAKRFCVSNGQLQERSDTSFQCYAQWDNITRESQDKLGWHCCGDETCSALCLQNIYEQLIKLQLSHNWAVTFCDSVFWNFIVQTLIYDTLNIIKSKNGSLLMRWLSELLTPRPKTPDHVEMDTCPSLQSYGAPTHELSQAQFSHSCSQPASQYRLSMQTAVAMSILVSPPQALSRQTTPS